MGQSFAETKSGIIVLQHTLGLEGLDFPLEDQGAKAPAG